MPKSRKIIESAKISKAGTTLKLNVNFKKIWDDVPGASIRKAQNRFRKIFFPGQFDPYVIVEDLKQLPQKPDSNFYLDLEDLGFSVYKTRSFLNFSYHGLADKLLANTKPNQVDDIIREVKIGNQNRK